MPIDSEIDMILSTYYKNGHGTQILTQPEATGERKPDHVAEVGLVPE